MKQYTSGPWTAGRNKGGGFGVWATPQQYNVLDRTAPGINAEANAKLIASAPEMDTEIDRLTAINKDLLEACKAIHADWIKRTGAIHEQARAAITKATKGTL